MPSVERYRVRDIEVRGIEAGSGPPMLFLHGASGLPDWNPFLETLAARHRLFVPEHPGFGESGPPPWIRDIHDMAMYYLDLLEERGLEGVHLVGHSLGGWIAAELAVRNTSRLRSLALLAPAGVRIRGLPCGDNFIWSPEEAARNAFYDQRLAEQRLAETPDEAEMDRRLRNRLMAAQLGWEPRWFDPALERWLHRIDVPTLVVWGEDDKLFPAAYAEVWRREVPRARVALLPRCGHSPHVEQAEATAAQVLDLTTGA